jgi:hypothetical protein
MLIHARLQIRLGDEHLLFNKIVVLTVMVFGRLGNGTNKYCIRVRLKVKTRWWVYSVNKVLLAWRGLKSRQMTALSPISLLYTIGGKQNRTSGILMVKSYTPIDGWRKSAGDGTYSMDKFSTPLTVVCIITESRFALFTFNCWKVRFISLRATLRYTTSQNASVFCQTMQRKPKCEPLNTRVLSSLETWFTIIIII